MRGCGQVANLLGRFEAAVPILEELTKIRRYGDAWLLLSRCRSARGDFAEALPAAIRAVEISPNRPDMHRYLAELYFRSGDRERAREHLEFSGRLSRGRLQFPGVRPDCRSKAERRLCL